MKLAILLETASLNEADVAAYCCKNGMYIENLASWKEEAIIAMAVIE